MRLFGLREDEDFLDLFAEVENQRAPQHLLDTIAQIYAWSSPLDVAEYFSTSIHKILNELIISSLYREGLVLTQQERITSSHLHPSESASEEDPARLELIYNLPLSRVVTHRGETKLLSGFADYSIWHGHDSTKNIQSLATNFLIVKVKRWNTVVSTTPELAAYMGIVHKHRVALKQDAVVYGLTSDGRYFHFHRIDNDGVFTDAKPLVWEWDAHRIFSIMSWLIRRAALLSPSTTPIKDPMQRSIVLESSGTPSQKVDCGFSQFNVYDQEELEEYDPLIAIRGRGSAERIRRISNDYPQELEKADPLVGLGGG